MRNQQNFDAFKASPRYVFHPENRVQRIPLKRQQRMHRTNLRITFRKIRKAMEQK